MFQIYLKCPEIEAQAQMGSHGLCATCVDLYMGCISSDEGFRAQVKTSADDAVQAGKSLVVLICPPPSEVGMLIQNAITTGPSWRIPALQYNPVCLTHVMGAAEQPTNGSNHVSPIYQARKGERH